MTGHTPGPWWDDLYEYPSALDVKRLREDASALLEALKVLLHGLPDFPHPETPQDAAVSFARARLAVRDIIAAHAAIAKAKGR